jgi:hypothetical protein
VHIQLADRAGYTIVSQDTCSGPVGDGGHNLLFAWSGCRGLTGNPLLGPLQHNGGPTKTMALSPGSAAIDQVPKTGAGGPLFARP